MKSMQRKFGGLMKRKDDEADVGQVLAEFRAVDDMLTQLIKDLTTYRNSWDDILKIQYDTTEAFATLYKPLDPSNDPDQRRPPTATPQSYMQKCLGLQKLYSDLKSDLYTEISQIDTKLIKPAQEAKNATKVLFRTLKHRENAKLDYERYLSRAEHARRKETRSVKEEAALAAHESNLAQAQIDYETADDQVKQTFPPVTAAICDLLPYILASQVMLQTTLVGQLYTVMDKYTRVHQMPNPAPGDAEIVREWESEFSGFRRELEQGISVVANGKAVQREMTLPPEKGSTLTGLGLRNKAGGMMHRKPSGDAPPTTPSEQQGSTITGMGLRNKAGIGGKSSGGGGGGGGHSAEGGSSMTGLGIRNKAGGLMHRPSSGHGAAPARPMIAGRQNSGMSHSNHEDSQALTVYNEEDEVAPLKPPRPGQGAPRVDLGSKPKISSGTAPYPHSPVQQAPPSYDSAMTSPAASRYATPVGNGAASAAHDYFSKNEKSPSATNNGHALMASSLASSAMSAAAAKKKAPPPIPQKRIMSGQAAPEYVTAIYDFEAQNAGDLAFREGDRILVVHKTQSTDDWWEGEVNGLRGSFPANYVRL